MDFQIAIWVQFVNRSIVYMYSEKQTPQWYISLWLYTYTELCVTLIEFVIVKSISILYNAFLYIQTKCIHSKVLI